MSDYVLYCKDDEGTVSVLGIGASHDVLQERAAQLESKVTEETGETIRWSYYLGDDVRYTEFHGMEYWIAPVERV